MSSQHGAVRIILQIVGQHMPGNVLKTSIIDAKFTLTVVTLRSRDREAEGLSVGVERGEYDSYCKV